MHTIGTPDAYPVRAVGLGDGYRARLNMHGVVPVDGVDVDVVGLRDTAEIDGLKKLTVHAYPRDGAFRREQLQRNKSAGTYDKNQRQYKYPHFLLIFKHMPILRCSG